LNWVGHSFYAAYPVAGQWLSGSETTEKNKKVKALRLYLIWAPRLKF